jgi:hypothetical protein
VGPAAVEIRAVPRGLLDPIWKELFVALCCSSDMG